MFTDREKELLVNLLSQIKFGLGESSLAKEYEVIKDKLEIKENIDKK